MLSHLDTSLSSSRAPTTRSIATQASDRRDRKTLAAILRREDRSTRLSEFLAMIGKPVIQGLEASNLLPTPKVNRTPPYHAAFTAARDTQAGIEENYTKASRVAEHLLETTQSLLFELDSPIPTYEDGNDDKDTKKAKLKQHRDLVNKQSDQLATLKSMFPGGFFRAPECLAEIMSMDRDDQACHHQIAMLCKTISSHDFALGDTIDREHRQVWGKSRSSETDSHSDSSHGSKMRIGDEERSAKSGS